MILNPIKEGLKVQVEIDTGSITGSRTRIDCYITKPEADRIEVTFPENKSEYLPYFQEGAAIKAFIYTFIGIMIVDSIVFDAPENGRMVIEYNEEHQTIQRRKYLRVAYNTDMYIVGEEGNIKTSTVDMSGGGVRFQSSALFTDMQNVSAQIRLVPFEPIIKVDGVIQKKSFFAENEYVLEFTQIDEHERDRIVHKCLEIEREQIQKLDY